MKRLLYLFISLLFCCKVFALEIRGTIHEVLAPENDLEEYLVFFDNGQVYELDKKKRKRLRLPMRP